jgi:gliding motility-associated-like protein
MRIITSFLLLYVFSGFCLGQVDHSRKHWAFGRNAMMSFDENGITGTSTYTLNGYRGTACYSNKGGDLILSTNGNAVYGKDNTLLASLFTPADSYGNSDALIIPKNTEETKFYIFIIEDGNGLRTVDVDLESKSVILRPNVFNITGSAFKLTAVKHCFSDAYWLIFPDNASTFYSFLVKPNSISEPVVSSVSSVRGSVGDFVSSHDGTMLALSSYLSDWAELYDFDKKCGIVSNARNLKTILGTENRPHGLSFSPDDKSLYVAWSHQQSNLYQYDLENWGGISNAVQSSQNINDVLLGIDGNLYLNVHENGNPSRRIHVVKNPNSQEGGGTRAIEDIATLPLATNGAFEFPTFISNTTGGHCGEVGDFNINSFLDNKNRCTNKQVYFSATVVDGTYDSIRWDFDDPGSSLNSSTEIRVKKDFKDDRLYNVRCFAFHCSFVDTFYLPIEMVHPPSFTLGNDSTVCFGSRAEVTIPQPFDTFFWQDGYTKASRLEESGVFIASISLNRCIVEDTITISQYPDIWTELNAEYYICDLESEATRLDAGKGFKKYKWTPTGDTTQWIIVEELGEYIVVVDAFNGCQGDGSTYVKRRCDLEYHIPNAFTPNGDEINATFKAVGKTIESQIVKIYNRWGEKIYEGPEWNGQNAIQGVYTYTIQIKGYQQKNAVRRQEVGRVTLLK